MRQAIIIGILTFLFSGLILGALSGCGAVFRKPKIPKIAAPGDIGDPIMKVVERINWWIPMLILGGVGGGVFSFCMGGPRLGIKIVAGTLVTVSITLGVIQFMWQLAVIGAIAGLLLMGYVIYINRRAFVLTVKGIENYKKVHPELKAEVNEVLSNAHGKDINITGLIKEGKTRLRKKAVKIGKEVDRVVNQVKDLTD